MQHRVGGDHPADQAGDGVEEAQPERAAPVLDDQGHRGKADGGDELGQPVDVGLHRVGGPVQRLVGATEADQVRRHGAQAGSARRATTVRYRYDQVGWPWSNRTTSASAGPSSM